MIREPATGGGRSVEEGLTIADEPLRQLLQGGGKFVFTMTAALAGSNGPSSTSAPWPGWRRSGA
jgi:hypothetical protein